MSLTPSEFASYDANGLAELLAKREVSPAELVECAVAATEALNPHLNAVVETFADPIMPKIPNLYMSKDLGVSEQGRKCEFGSRLAVGSVASHDSALTTRFKQAGMINVDGTTTSELGIAGVTETVAFGPTSTPWDLSRNAGGSSGGAGAAVAAGIVPIAQGSDAGGSKPLVVNLV